LDYGEPFNESQNFERTGTPFDKMQIGRKAQLKKLNDKIVWDWDIKTLRDIWAEEIVDIIEYRGCHVKVSEIFAIGRSLYDEHPERKEYIGVPDTGEPFSTDPPPFDTPEEALQFGKDCIDIVLDQ
jgi:hypothetical protein